VLVLNHRRPPALYALALPVSVLINPNLLISADSNKRRDKMRGLKWILLGIYLILAGLALLGVNLGGNVISLIAGICAVIAGILFLINR
jgi:hypothetical protein